MSTEYTKLVKLPINESDGPTKSPPSSNIDEYKKPRKCERSNHIPVIPDIVYSRKEWHTVYNTELIDMYSILRSNLNRKYPDNTINWDKNNETIFHNFSKLLYHCSSKHIDSYDLDKYNETISKDINDITKDGESEETTNGSSEGMSDGGHGDVSEEWNTTRKRRVSRYSK